MLLSPVRLTRKPGNEPKSLLLIHLQPVKQQPSNLFTFTSAYNHARIPDTPGRSNKREASKYWTRKQNCCWRGWS